MASRSVDAALQALDNASEGDTRPARQLLANGTPDAAAAWLLRAQLAAMSLESEEYERALASFWASPPRDAGLLKRAYRLGATTTFADGEYAASAAQALQLAAFASAEGDAEGAQGALQLHAMVEALGGVPPATVDRQVPETSPALRDKATLLRVTFTANGVDQEAVLDTGANISVATESTARKLKLRMLSTSAKVGNSVGSNIATRLGVAEQLQLAGLEMRNVVFLVLPDSQLAFPGGYTMDAIIGLPVIRRLGRMEVSDGQLSAAPSAARPGAGSNIVVAGSEMFVDVEVGGTLFPLFLDTGANNTRLASRALPLLPKGRLGQFEERIERQTGAGGGADVKTRILPQAPFRIGGTVVTLPRLRFETDQARGKRWGVVGSDVLSRLARFTIDFGAMRLDAVAREKPLGD